MVVANMGVKSEMRRGRIMILEEEVMAANISLPLR